MKYKCKKCGTIYSPKQISTDCPKCGSWSADVIYEYAHQPKVEAIPK